MQFKITNPNHKLFGKTGTVTRVDVEVEGWFSSVKLEDGEFLSAQQAVQAENLHGAQSEGSTPTKSASKGYSGNGVTGANQKPKRNWKRNAPEKKP